MAPGTVSNWETGWMVAALVLAALIVVLTAFFPESPVFSWGTFWQAAAALSTASAAIIALRVAGREDRWRQDQRASNSAQDKHYAISLVPDMIRCKSELFKLSIDLSCISAEDPTSVMNARKLLSEIADYIEKIDLAKISAVSPESGTQLAIAKYQLGLMNVFFPNNQWDEAQFECRKKAITGNLKKAIDAFTQAFSELQNFANSALG